MGGGGRTPFEVEMGDRGWSCGRVVFCLSFCLSLCLSVSPSSIGEIFAGQLSASRLEDSDPGVDSYDGSKSAQTHTKPSPHTGSLTHIAQQRFWKSVLVTFRGYRGFWCFYLRERNIQGSGLRAEEGLLRRDPLGRRMPSSKYPATGQWMN